MQGKVEGAMSSSGAMHRFEPDSIPRIAAEVKAAGEAASPVFAEKKLTLY
jgi:hypothetical protein